jgi:hypothetical protein
MPTREHDVVAELFRWRPAIAADLMSGLVTLPGLQRLDRVRVVHRPEDQ